MDTPRFFVNESQIKNQNFSIVDRKDIKKIKKVLRLKENAKVILVTEKHKEYLGEINLIEPNNIAGYIRKELKNKKIRQKIPKLILAQALTRSGKLDWIIKSNTELGISEFIFFESQFSVFRLKNFKPSKLTRWKKIAKEAVRQSEQLQIPIISSPMSFKDLMDMDIKLKLLFIARKGKHSINLDSLQKQLKSFKNILITIGPEGGFSDKEIDLARENGFKIITLPFPVLRTETSGIVANAVIINYINSK